MKIDYDTLREELNKLSKEEIQEIGILLPVSPSTFYKLKSRQITTTKFFNLENYMEVRSDFIQSKEEAIKIVHPLKFKGRKEYQKWKKANNRFDLPFDPNTYYKISTGEFLGNGYVASQYREFVTKEEFLKIVPPLKLKSRIAYVKWRNINERMDLSSEPDKKYNLTWYEILGKRNYKITGVA